MAEFWKTIAGIMVSLGGGTFIVMALSSWLGKVWADRLMRRETAKFREELERLTKQLERKNYVSKVRFDAEFAIYRDLSAAFFEMVRFQNNLFVFTECTPDDPEEQKKYYIAKLDECGKAYNHASTQLYRNAPFIEENIYERFKSILDAVKLQLFHYPTYWIDEHRFEFIHKSKDEYQECYRRTETINEEMDKLILDLRAYLKSLDVA